MQNLVYMQSSKILNKHRLSSALNFVVKYQKKKFILKVSYQKQYNSLPSICKFSGSKNTTPIYFNKGFCSKAFFQSKL